MNSDYYSHGAVLKILREDTEESIKKSLSQMKESGFNTVVIWPACFWWEEKKKGYPYNTGRFILKTAEELGLEIIMELAGQITCMEYMPDFLMKDEFYARKQDGSIEFGQPSFGYLNYFNPKVKKIIAKNFKNTAKAYKNFKALKAYDIFNETMFRSFDKYTINEFRVWLKEKYGTIEKLNRVWERTYTSFSQITYQEWKWLSVMPQADYYSFRKAAITRFLKHWCEAVRSVDNTHPLIADNIFSMVTTVGSYSRPQDDFALQEQVDIIGMSFYPKSMNGLMHPALRHEVFSGMFAASKYNGFLLSEMQTHIQAIFNANTAVKPEELRLWCYEAIAGGAIGLIYWMWKPFYKGLQTMGRGLVDYKDRPTERLDIARELSAFFAENKKMKPIRAKTAIIYDDFCEDLQKTYTMAYKAEDNIYVNSIYGAYSAFFDANISCDIAKIEDIDKYETIVLVNQLALSRENQIRLCEFVKKGGNVIIDGKTGITDELSHTLENIPCGEFNGFTGEDYIDSRYENLSFKYNNKAVSGFDHRDIVSVYDGAETEAVFEDGTPAVVSKKSGGTVLTINTQLFLGYIKNRSADVLDFVKDLAKKFSLYNYELPDTLYCKLSKNSDANYAFIFNYTAKEQSGTFKTEGYKAEVTLNPNEVKVLRW